jgi:uncharacterized membrane protein
VTPLQTLELAAATFVGTHFLMSHLLRRPMVRLFGDTGFLGVYSLVSLGTFGWMIWAARGIGEEAPRWVAGPGLLVVAGLLMWIGSILFAGSFKGNPSLPNPDGAAKIPSEPRGAFRITRHPMMWGFGLWAMTHAIANPTPSGLVLAEAIFALAIVGAALQDMRKRRQYGHAWRQWERKSPFFPFTRGFFWPGTFPVVAGTLLFLAATWAHGWLGSMPVGPWTLLG